MAFRLPDRWGCVGLLTFLFAPGLVLGYLLHSMWWMVATPLGLIILMLAVAALPIERKVTPQKWADELEKHLIGTDGPHGWDDATSVTLADPQLENRRFRLCHDFDQINTSEKREEFRQIIEALRRGEIP